MLLKSPLRYPGSKAKLVNYIAELISCNGLKGGAYYEPYAGGASVALSLLNEKVVSKATLGERDPLVYSFWKCAIEHPQELCERIKSTPVTLKTWKSFQHLRGVFKPNRHNLLELGFAGLFFNRTNFSGVISAGPIGGMSQSSAYSIDCRFNKSTLISQIQKISQFKGQLEVRFEDCLDFLEKLKPEIATQRSFVYLDPPYFKQGHRCYRYHYVQEDHEALAAFIKAQEYAWLVSYDCHPEIEKIYQGQEAKHLYLDYSAKVVRRGTELLISNLELPLPLYQMAKKKKAEFSHDTICSVSAVAA